MTVLLLMLPMTVSAKELYRDAQVTVSELKHGVDIFETYDNCAMYLVKGSERALLIDTGTKCDALKKIVDSLVTTPVDVVITHLHPDHAGCVGQFDNFYMHPADTVMLHEYDIHNEIRFIEDGHRFDLGDTVVEALLMPGHTPGSIVLLNRANGDCFSGDAFGVWMQLVPHTPMVCFLGSCHRMLGLMEKGDAVSIWGGHYPYYRRALGKSFMETMTGLASRLSNGDETGAVDYTMPPSMHCSGHPKILMENGASIVYNTEKIN